jgi:hypothetical protein
MTEVDEKLERTLAEVRDALRETGERFADGIGREIEANPVDDVREELRGFIEDRFLKMAQRAALRLVDALHSGREPVSDDPLFPAAEEAALRCLAEALDGVGRGDSSHWKDRAGLCADLPAALTVASNALGDRLVEVIQGRTGVVGEAVH